MAFHSGFLTNRGTDYLYVALTYDADPGPDEARRLMVRRYTYDARSETLGNPLDLLTGLPAGNDHISGRLVFGRDSKLYMTVGDQGFNQLALYCQPIHSQELPTAGEVTAKNWDSYQGKVLRINLDGSIPADNPMLNGVRSHIYSYGHRNGQGLALGPDGKLYESEHGPSMDDELNVIEAGKNYGWPYVAGYKDDRVYVYANWSAATVPCSTLTFDPIVAPATVPQQKESAWTAPNFAPPLRTFFTVDSDYRFKEQGNATIAPSGIDVYGAASDGIPGWTTSVLVTSLLRGVVYRVKLTASGDAAVGDTLEYFKMKARFRDVMIAPDGRTIYVATDTGSAENPSSVLAFTYQPSATR
jgi:PQQ-dependent dehydrogenase (s-GDH family)